MIRAVIDTNLIVSYLLTQSETLSRLIGHWEQGNFAYLVSPALMNELSEVVTRPKLRRHMRGDPATLVDLVAAEAEWTPGILTLSGVCRDPKDDSFIACAVEGNATYLVTGDADLLDMGAYQGVTMIRAVDFVNMLDSPKT